MSARTLRRKRDILDALQRLWERFGRDSVFSAARVAGEVGCSVTTARRYLEALNRRAIVARYDEGSRVFYRWRASGERY